MRYAFGCLSLVAFVAFFPLIALAVKGEYPGNVVAGVFGLMCLIATYFFFQVSKRLRDNKQP